MSPSHLLSELSGSLGDLGTLLPLLIALTTTSSISLSATLIVSGLANILTGWYFRLPLPVQPMKAIASVAIARAFTKDETMAAGLFVAAAVGTLSLTGLLGWVGRVVPIPVVKGIQVGAGVSLVVSAGGTVLRPLGWTTPGVEDNLSWALVAFLFLLYTGATRSRIPYALLIFLLGLVPVLYLPSSQLPRFQLWRPSLHAPSFDAFKTGIISAGVGQLPLTILNSVIAVNHLSTDLLPQLAPPSTTALGYSIAGINLVGCWFGAMPVCHGSGGLAAQYRFGARTGASVIILGVFKLLLGLIFGESLVGVLQRFPKAFLGVMVIAAGLELAKVGESLNRGARDLWEVRVDEVGLDDARDGKIGRVPDDEESQHRWMVMLMTVGGLLAFKNDAVGFAAGMLCHWSFRLADRLQGRRRTSSRGWSAADREGESEGLLDADAR
ncbi:MAG: hypothetical protein M1817_002359 [Caeruleum heppii]|nr:MAG: hypothetical protein M1817_003456 [Caeruleum heppii]KAI9673721.1 MAG: hypothetical protein M1817_002359 [Caeruleum heppii]